jgi:hypothetical protein
MSYAPLQAGTRHGHLLLILPVLLAALLLTACVSRIPLTAGTVPPPQTPTPAPAGAAPVDPLPAGAAVAFVRDDVLMIQLTPPHGEMVEVEDCRARGCRILFPVWSPDGNWLLYTVGTFDRSVPPEVRVSDRTGRTQTVGADLAFTRPADWSPAGNAVVYLRWTELYVDNPAGPMGRVLDVMTVPLGADGVLGVAEVAGQVIFGEGCGGGGRSEAAEAYEDEGGFAYGYLAGIVRWTAGDILLYSSNCGSVGVGRFDMATGTELEPLPGNLRSLALNAARDTFVALNADGRIVTGAPGSLQTETVASTVAPERVALVFMGQLTGNIYYTTIEQTDVYDRVDQAAQVDPSLLFSPYFDTTRAGLYVIGGESGTEAAIIEIGSDPEAYAYARVQESFDGRLLFSRVQSGDALQAALEEGTLTAATLPDVLPRTDVLWVLALDAGAQVLLEDAAQFALALPLK